MSTKITACGLCSICTDHLQGCPEDDTIFSERTASTFGNVVYRRSGVGAPERFLLFRRFLVKNISVALQPTQERKRRISYIRCFHFLNIVKHISADNIRHFIFSLTIFYSLKVAHINIILQHFVQSYRKAPRSGVAAPGRFYFLLQTVNPQAVVIRKFLKHFV